MVEATNPLKKGLPMGGLFFCCAVAGSAYSSVMVDDFLHSPDPLRNLSYLVGRCLICGQEHRETVMGESKMGFCLCDCGNIVRGINKTLWN